MKKIAGILLLSFLVTTNTAAAEEYIVSKGDTLFKLSRQFGLGVEQLKKLNQLSSDTVFLGQKLIVSDKSLGGGINTLTTQEVKSVSSTPVTVRTQGRSAVITGETVNVRQERHIESKVLITLKKGTSVEIVEPGELWTQIKWGETAGFIYTPLLASVKEESVSRSADLSASRIQQLISPLIGTPYRAGGSDLNGFDCSGFTSYVMSQLGVKLPRISEEQFSVGTLVERENWKVGDLLFFDSYSSGKISHVGIYIGNNKMAHSAVKSVEISDVTWYLNNYPFYGAKRVLGD
ncbi:C40 family peptidase [Ammoniphilus sp. CFH 90114]|uniref:C40 family peptidase n=1 Tax=Ammoniphilus sp. CFH 90114 TaxID=2493665 RepID=UPI00100F9D40|nr:C40 family peptidase [Ammoniphilus sp. CFH 90114]RXT15280.1 LysM peptidoglycan-binding domain-containing protein [Ammoniphilus sp. CFH 90114]